MREDFIDFPTGWELQRAGLTHVTLALPYAWVERCVAQRVARGEDETTARADQMQRAAPYGVRV